MIRIGLRVFASRTSVLSGAFRSKVKANLDRTIEFRRLSLKMARMDGPSSSIRGLLVLLLIFQLFGVLLSSDTSAQEHVFDGEGVALIDCGCVPASSGCRSQILEFLASGGNRHRFTREIFVSDSGLPIELSEVCWRYDARNDLACCQAQNRQEAKQFFRGTVADFPAD